MKVILIFPSVSGAIDIYTNTSIISDLIRRFTPWGKTNHTPPIGLMMLAAVTPPDIEVEIVDERLEPIDFDAPADLVGITVVTQAAPRAYQIAGEFRRRGVKVVLGGVHPSALPREASQHADALVLGEGEGVWPELLADLRAGSLKPLYRGRPQPDLDTLPFPRRTALRHPDMYVTTKVVNATRGCPNTCTFCAAGVGLIKRYRKRGVPHVIRELEQTPGKMAIFVDDNLGWEADYTRALLQALRPLHLRWTGELSINAMEAPGMIDLAAESGCFLMSVGLESLSPRVLSSVCKDGTNQPEKFAPLIRRMQQAGMAVWVNFIIGFDEEERDTIPRVMEFIHQNNVELATIYILTPYPGAPLFKRYERQGRLLHRNWLYYESVGGTCVYTPSQMTPGQLMDEYLELIDELYSLRSVAQRLLRSPSRLTFSSLSALHLNLENRRSVAAQRQYVARYKAYLAELQAEAPQAPEMLT